MIQTAGNRGAGIRSDCFVSLDPELVQETEIHITSKVKSMYGDSILELCRDMLEFYHITHARLEIEDTGALPFTLAARIEAVVRKSIKTDKDYLLPLHPNHHCFTPRDRDRITRLYLPGNNPKLMINAGIYGADGIILDLEDSVAPERKYEARFLVRNALRCVDFYGAERMVRINQLPTGLDDLPFCIHHGVHVILIPKCEGAEQVLSVDKAIAGILGGKNHPIYLMPIIESAAGVMHACEIANSSKQVVALVIGLEDYTADLGAQRTTEGNESFFARSMIVNAARAAGIQPIDSVFSDVDDMESLAGNVKKSKALGFAGMGCIHPRQVKVIRESFLPDAAECDKAMKIVQAFEGSEKEGSGVVSLNGKMIDPPVVKRALNTIERAVKFGLLPENWRTAP
ncbi:MAG: HpcH/HpaI aldolase/citrate lyase family protein [Bacteroidales bacterium]|nr:HpcH/HpaI aldolase/citrate lyase family protein [Bacteroidales bacterium]